MPAPPVGHASQDPVSVFMMERNGARPKRESKGPPSESVEVEITIIIIRFAVVVSIPF